MSAIYYKQENRGPNRSFLSKKKEENFEFNDENQDLDLGLDRDTEVRSVFNEIPLFPIVKNSIQKLTCRKAENFEKETYCVRLLVSFSEMSYFNKERFEGSDSIFSFVKKSYGISNISTSKSPAGSVDRIIFLYGEIEKITRGAIFLGYIFNARLNNFDFGEPYTLKSANYKLVLVFFCDEEPNFHNIEFANRLQTLESSEMFNYNCNSNLYTLLIEGDFGTLFRFLVHCISTLESPKSFDNDSIKQISLYGNHVDAELFVRSKEKAETLENSVRNATRSVYSTFFLD